MQDKQNDPAVQYARTRVQQIRKRLGHYQTDNSNKNFSSNSKARQNSKTSAEFYNRQNNTSTFCQNKKNSPKKALQSSSAYKDYENRIKNIDMINNRIKSVLKYQEKNNNSINSRAILSNMYQNNQNHIASKTAINFTSSNEPKKILKLTDFNKNEYAVSIELGKKQHTLESSRVQSRKTGQQLRRDSQLKSSKKNRHNQQLTNNIQERKNSSYKQKVAYNNTSSHKNNTYKDYQKKQNQNKQINQQITTQLNEKKFQSDRTTAKFKIQKQEAGRQQTIKLASRLSQQIKLDQKLRQLKWEFLQYTGQDKWSLLFQSLKAKGYSFKSIEQIQTYFTLCPQENNPFFQASSPIDVSCIKSLIQSFSEADQNWKQQISQCASIKKLENQNFSINDIDSTKKGYISLEDLVCFINLYSGNFFRNRDVFSIHRRFNKGQDKTQLSYKNFLDKVTTAKY